MKPGTKPETPICSNRRKLVEMLAFTGLLIPFASRLTSRNALASEKLLEDDPTAVSLSYKHDATQATHEAYSSGRDCAGCLFFQGGDASAGPCPVFSGKLVNAKGWCASWRQRG